MVLVDTHAHLGDDRYDSDRNNIIRRFEEDELKFVVEIGVDVVSSKEALQMAYRCDKIYAAIGVHPHDVKSLDESQFDELRSLAKFDRCVAVGEIGLDFYRNLSPVEIQCEWFERQLELAIELKKPVVLHIRDAYEQALEILKKYVSNGINGVVHCFSSDWVVAKKILDMDFKIGIGGPLTYKNNDVLREVIRKTPLEMIVSETDCPYLTPEPFRGKRNEPSYVKYVVEQIADLKRKNREETAHVLYQNALNLYGIKM